MTAKTPKNIRAALWISRIGLMVFLVLLLALYVASRYVPENAELQATLGMFCLFTTILGLACLTVELVNVLPEPAPTADTHAVEPEVESRPRERAVCTCAKCSKTRRCTKYSFRAGKHYGTRTEELYLGWRQTTETFSNVFLGSGAYICPRCVRRRFLRESYPFYVLMAIGVLLCPVGAAFLWGLPPYVTKTDDVMILFPIFLGAVLFFGGGILTCVMAYSEGHFDCGSNIAIELDRKRLEKEGYNWFLTPRAYRVHCRSRQKPRGFPW